MAEGWVGELGVFFTAALTGRRTVWEGEADLKG